MTIENPFFRINNKENNIFTIREKEYASLLDNVREIIKPAEEAGFELTNFGLKEATSFELEKTIKKQLMIKFKKGTQEIDLSMLIPKIINKNYIMISGKKKIPLFQLFDIPIVTRGEHIKIRTNITTILITVKDTLKETRKQKKTKKDSPDNQNSRAYVTISFMGKEVPFALMCLCYFGFDAFCERLQISKFDRFDSPKTPHDKFLTDVYGYYLDGDPGEKFLIEELGKYYTTYDFRKKGEINIYALDLISKIDIMTMKFMEHDNIPDEIISLLENGANIDDTHYLNKRVRCFEYVVLSTVMKAIFDLCISSKNSKIKFNINSKQILSKCNVSDIVQFDFSINPIDELTKLSRTTLVGPGGFEKDNIPHYLRDLSPSMFGRVCPVDTSDRGNCGVLQCLLPSTQLDENLKFVEAANENQPTSIAVSMVPFLEHDDPTRLQMAASQMRQAINLSDFDIPLVKSGCEGLYTDYSSFVKRARKNGEVVYKDARFLFVVYDDKDYDLFEIANRSIYVENMDIMNVFVEVGDKISTGDILAESNFCKNGEISIGKNLLTAIMPYYGYNYEDAIVISDTLVKNDKFTSIHHIDLSFTLPPDKVLVSLEKESYKPLPSPRPNIELQEPGKSMDYYKRNKRELVLAGQPYAILKDIPNDPLQFYSVFEEKIPLVYKKDVLITDVTIFPNEYNDGLSEFKEWVEKKFAAQAEEDKRLQEVVAKLLPTKHAADFIRENGLDKFNNRGKFKIKGEKVNGIHVKISGFFSRKIQVGDKIGNRHGNKGIISKILPHNMMPQLPDGRHADIIINPLSTLSRMNVGQIFELHLGMSVNDMKFQLVNMLKNKEPQDKMKTFILDYIKILDNTTKNWYSKQFEQELVDKDIDLEFIKNLSVIQPPFESSRYEMLHKACEYSGTDIEYEIYEPYIQRNLVSKIAVGYMYFFRMVHIAESRLAARGIGSYVRKTMQPPGGRKNKGGQRCGEMETFCFISHGGLINLNEMLTTKSDSIDLKNKYIRDMIGSEFIREIHNECNTPESVKLLMSYLTAVGISND